jgi:hypothetical protein
MHRWHRPALLLTALLALAACTSSSGTGPGPATNSSSNSAAAPRLSPLTGRAYSNNPVVAVKIEDTALGRPQVGVNKADIVYVEQVEGGLTRLMAIFNSSLPTVEPVRSVRPSDPELALQLGHITFVASGGSRAGIAPLDASPLKSVINDRNASGFTRDGSRQAPENLRADLAQIAKKYPGDKARDIGLTWSAGLPAGRTQIGTSVDTKVGGTPVAFHWAAKQKRYVRLIDGQVQHTANGALIATPNVIVQYCQVTTYTKDRDVLGNPAKFTHTVGAGKAVVFRNGRRIDGTWSRKSVDDGTSFTSAAGRSIPLSPGGAWIVLVATNAPLS